MVPSAPTIMRKLNFSSNRSFLSVLALRIQIMTYTSGLFLKITCSWVIIERFYRITKIILDVIPQNLSEYYMKIHFCFHYFFFSNQLFSFYYLRTCQPLRIRTRCLSKTHLRISLKNSLELKLHFNGHQQTFLTLQPA